MSAQVPHATRKTQEKKWSARLLRMYAMYMATASQRPQELVTKLYTGEKRSVGF